MMICLKTSARQHGVHEVRLQAKARLPVWIESATEMACRYEVQTEGRYHLLRFSATGNLVICCQRCLQSVPYEYVHTSELAVCSQENEVEQLMASYECVLSDEGELDLLELLTDELVLNSPQIPHALSDCVLDLG